MLCFPSSRKVFIAIRLLVGRSSGHILGLRRQLDTLPLHNQSHQVTPLGRWTQLRCAPVAGVTRRLQQIQAYGLFANSLRITSYAGD
jgi:hypothetical protein